MIKSKKPLAILSAAAVAGLITAAVSTPVSAKSTLIDVKGTDGKYYDYNLDALKTSAVSFALNGATDPGAQLYNNFVATRTSGSIAGFYDDVKKAYVDFATVSSAAVQAILNNQPFLLDTFTSATATPTTTTISSPNAMTTDANGNVLINGQPINNPTPTQLSVSSVSAINAKQVKVVFDNEIDTTKISAANFVVTQKGDIAGTDRLTDALTSTNFTAAAQNASGAAGQPGTGKVSVQSDNKTVILTLDNSAWLTNPTTVTVKTTGVVAKSGAKLADTVTSTDTLSDVTAPSVVKAETAGENVIRVYFSEPVVANGVAGAIKNADSTTDATALANGAAFRINDGAVAVDGANITRDPNNACAVLVKTGSALTSGTQYTVKVNATGVAAANQLVDYAGYSVLANSSVSFTQTADTNAPTVTATPRSERVLRLTFDKTVTIPSNANIEFRYAYNSDNASVVKTVATGAIAAVNVAGRTDSQFDVTLPNPMNAGAGVVYVHYNNPVNATKTNVVTDQFGNVLPDGTAINFTVTPDTTAPTASAVYYDATHIDVTYSEPVANAQVATNYSLKDPKGNDVAIQNVGVQDALHNVYRLTVGTMSAGGNYTFAINSNNVTDVAVAQNKLTAYSTTIAAADKTAPTVALLTGVSMNAATIAASDTLYVSYSEPMSTTGTMSAIDASNYRLAINGGATDALPTGTVLTQNGNVVTIKLPAAPTKAYDRLVVGKVADVAGNAIVDATGNAVLSLPCTINASATIPNAGLVVANSTKATDNRTIQFDVNRQLTSVLATQITTSATTGVGAGARTGQSATFVNNSDGTATVTVKFDGDIPTDLLRTDDHATAVTLNIGTTAFVDTNALTTLSGAINGTAIEDDIAPAIISAGVTTVDADHDGEIDHIVVPFTENLYAASVQDTDFTVDGYEVTSVALDNDANPLTAGDGTNTRFVELAVKEKATPDTAVTPKVTLVGQVQDASSKHNSLGAQSAITAVDGAAPVIVGVSLTDAAGTATSWDGVGDVLTLKFSEPVTLADGAKTAADVQAITGVPGVAYVAGPPASTVTSAGNGTDTITLTIGGAALGTGITTTTAVPGTASATLTDAAAVPVNQAVSTNAKAVMP